MARLLADENFPLPVVEELQMEPSLAGWLLRLPARHRRIPDQPISGNRQGCRTASGDACASLDKKQKETTLMLFNNRLLVEW